MSSQQQVFRAERKPRPGLFNTVLKEEKVGGQTLPDFRTDCETEQSKVALGELMGAWVDGSRQPTAEPHTGRPLVFDRARSQGRSPPRGAERLGGLVQKA